MAFFRFPHPWDPGYAIPGYVRAEPPGRGAFVTKYIPRGTIDTVRTGRGNWAVPGYVMSESGQGARNTVYMPRRFVETLAPDYLAKFTVRGNQRANRVARARLRDVVYGSLSGTVFDGKRRRR